METDIEKKVKLILSILTIMIFLPFVISFVVTIISIPFLPFIGKYIFTDSFDDLTTFIFMPFSISALCFFGMLFYLKIIKTNFFEFSSMGVKIVLYILFFVVNIILCLSSFGILELYNSLLDSIFENKTSPFKTFVPIIRDIVTPCYLLFFLINAFLPIPLFIDNLIRKNEPLEWYNWIISIVAATIILIILLALLISLSHK